MKPASPIDDGNAEGIGRRRVPRRSFVASVGVLIGGKYSVERAYQLGEGGMMIDLKGQKLKVGMLTALNFFLPGGGIVMVRGIVRAIVPANAVEPERYGLEFLNLGFQHKRAIRNFVAAATREDGQSAFSTYY
jgi:c-di-GMP-binding flagellar brake protein YcgR